MPYERPIADFASKVSKYQASNQHCDFTIDIFVTGIDLLVTGISKNA